MTVLSKDAELDAALVAFVRRHRRGVTATMAAEQLWSGGWQERFEPSSRSHVRPWEQFHRAVTRRLARLAQTGRIALQEERGWRGARQYEAPAAEDPTTGAAMSTDDRPDVEVTPALTDLATQLGHVRSEIAEIQARHDRELLGPRSQERELSSKVAAEIARQVGADPSMVALDGGHPCEASPTGWCVYDEADDPARDFCLFCHQPDERK